MSELIDRQAAIDAIVAWTVKDRPDVEMPTDLVDRIANLPSAQPEPCEDAISRADIVWHDYLVSVGNGQYRVKKCAYKDEVDEMPSVTQKCKTGKWIPYSELIDRQAAIDAMGEEPEVWTGRDEYAMGLNNQWHYDVNALKAVPTAQPEILRCKDCKYWDSFPSCSAFSDLHICKYWMGKISTMEVDFCSRAERKEE